MPGEIGNFLAYGFANASTIAPLGTVALISNAIIAPLCLKEIFRSRDLFGIILSILGAVIIVVYSPSTERKFGPEELIHAIIQIKFIVYLLITIAIAVSLTMLRKKYSKKIILIDLGLCGVYGTRQS